VTVEFPPCQRPLGAGPLGAGPLDGWLAPREDRLIRVPDTDGRQCSVLYRRRRRRLEQKNVPRKDRILFISIYSAAMRQKVLAAMVFVDGAGDGPAVYCDARLTRV
jgi:hypothetical protein